MNLHHMIRRILPIVVVLYPAVFGIAPAQAEEDIPTYKILTCGNKSCPHIVEPVLVARLEPSFPTYKARLFVEALVDIHYTIGIDGKVSDVKIERLLGPQVFADRARAAVSEWKFKPATEDGKPVTRNKRIRFMFRVRSSSRGARRAVVAKFDDAISLAKNGKTTEAIASLKSIIAQPDLNFYERTMITRELAILYVRSENYEDALVQIRDATISEGYYLDRRVRIEALRLRIELEANNGQLAEAFAWFDILKKYTKVDNDDSVAKLIAKLHASIDAPQPLAFDVKVSDASNPIWQHTLLRRTFGFAQIQGKLDGFELRCDVHGIESAVSDKAQWTVPKSWTGCMIYVKGTPGTGFRFLEAHSTNG